MVNHLRYGSFGQILGQTDADYEPGFTYTGRQYDSDAGLYYYRARWYDAGNGRFVNDDPLGFGGNDTNLSRYVGNNPTNYTDPAGTTSNSGWGLATDHQARPRPIERHISPYYGLMGPGDVPDPNNASGNLHGGRILGLSGGGAGGGARITPNADPEFITVGNDMPGVVWSEVDFKNETFSDIIDPTPVCFAAGTPVLMADGKWKKIEEIEPGDLVLSAHEHDPEGRVEAKTVLEVYHHEPRPIVEVEIQGGVIRCTPKHPFYVRDHGWTAAEDLPPAAQFRTREGTWTALKKKRITQTTEPVFNFAVEENHTYFVGNGNETAILVHNDSGKVAKTILEVYAKVRLIGTGSAEFVLKNGEKIVIRNAKFIETWITTKELAIFTNVDLHTLKEVEKKFPKIKVFYDKMGQPIFPKECIKYTVDKLTPKELIGDYAKIALDSLELKDPELYKRLINEGIGRYVWHHAGDGSLQLIDKDVHRAFQHTGLKSVLKKSLLTPLVLAGLLIPGTEQFANGDVNGGCREFTIAFTPLVWSEVGAAGLEVFYDELQRELEEGDMGVNKPATPEQMNRLNDQIQYGPHGYGLDIDLGYGT